MTLRTAGLAAAFFICCAPLAQAQTPLTLQISDGRVTLHAQNVPVRAILSEWSRLGGAKIVNGDRVTGAPLTLDLEGVPERQALDIILRSVSGYMLAAREPGAAGASMYDRIMILPTSVAPRNPPPAPAPPAFQGGPAGIIRPIMPRQLDDDQGPEEPDPTANDGVPLGRPVPMPRPVVPGMPVSPGMPVPVPVFPPVPVTSDPDVPQPQMPAGVVPTPANPFGLPAGSSGRPGVITPVPTQPPPGATRNGAQD